jgi:predicted RNA binding protein YcfA (HicA-like mRNA interferase family)
VAPPPHGSAWTSSDQITAAGWIKARQTGSHQAYTVPVGTLAAIRCATGVEDLR